MFNNCLSSSVFSSESVQYWSEREGGGSTLEDSDKKMEIDSKHESDVSVAHAG